MWSFSTETPNAGGIAFAPNITPGSYNEPPPLVDAPVFESILFPPPDDCPTQRRTGHSRKKPENHIPRPPNAFILFRSSFIKSQHVSTEVETNHSTLSKIIGLTWQNLPNEERQIWHAKAKATLEEHKRKFPQYAFKPLHTKGRGGGTEKRKVREVGPKDHKRCAKIAELLVKGKKGQELDAAIQEFDKYHVPEVVTRFEAPITANAFRRSSSAPIPDSEESKRPYLASNSSSASSSRSVRASSSQPRSCPSAPPPPSSSKLTAPESTQDAVHEASFTASPFDQYSFPEQTPSFDFNTFSFDNLTPLPSSFTCNPLAQSATPLPEVSFSTNLNGTESKTRQLSIDTSFMNMESWTRSSSPMSTSTASMPATPFDSPSPDYGAYVLEATSDYAMGKFGDLGQYPSYSDSPSVPFNGCEGYSSSASFAHFEQEPKLLMASADLDFSAFMNSLPPYSLAI
ncbi:hypothetical protein BDQ12DRAFT_671599 [Crucibulum laeve]|uniref:HMG box domain-containing protein n=1 Tax=Crucibulum laeve TaxID=68775 RepID=A0A5C3LG54_9AGAR|nr:hypothetical protein BDQ12DRAFT_671599 [Crucibulum laeve]